MENQTKDQYLKQNWEAVAASYCQDQEVIDAIFEDMYHRYSERHRAYHNHQHIVELLQLIEDHTDSAHRNIHVMAAFFHDIVYVPGNNDNEWQSSLLATELMTKIGVSAAEIEAVSQIILATQNHEWFDASIPN